MIKLHNEIKSMIIDTLNLEDIAIADIGTDVPLFGDGLGLDSVDALELGLALQAHYGINVDPERRNMREHFATVASLAQFVQAHRTGGQP